MQPAQSTLKRLFARSGDRCAFPRCVAPLTHNDTLIGEVCHIKGDKPGAARYDAAQVAAERQAYDNLIVLCPNHHTVIDDDEMAYTVERLLRMKIEHEANATALPDAAAERVAALFVSQEFSNVGQVGGVSAHNIHAHTINVSNLVPAEPLTAKRQLQAVETLWRTIGAMREELGQLVFVDTIYTRDELEGYFNSRWPQSMSHMTEYANRQTVISKFKTVKAMEADQERPFVSHRLWSVYYIIRALYGRIGYLFEQSFAKKTYHDWRKDSGADQLLRTILPSGVVEQVMSFPVYGLQSAFDHLEEQFMAEAKMRVE
jgi:hypothetical protein